MSQNDSIRFGLPVKIPLSFSSSFGEFRSNHFHSGIDIRTEGKEGVRVYSIEEGYVSRIRISPWSYGNTIYIDHPNGYTSVYAHLQSFNSEIEKLTRQLQYENKKYDIDILIEKDRLKISKGEFIALTGNTGRSFGPHLHFEIRETNTEFPVDPFQFYPQIKDDINPVFKSLYVYEFYNNSLEVNKKTKYNVYGDNGKYTLDKIINTSGLVAFGIEFIDYINGSNNKCGVKSMTLMIDSVVTYKFVLDHFSYSDKRYINALIDYKEYYENDKIISKLFVEPGNYLDLYTVNQANGICKFNDNKIHKVDCIISDYRDNVSTLSFEVQSRPEIKSEIDKDPMSKFKMNYNASNVFKNDSVSVIIPDSSLYNTINFKFDVFDKNYGSLTPIYQFHESSTPLHDNVLFSIKLGTYPDSLQSKLLIARLSDRNRAISCGGYYHEGWISAENNVFGKYMILLDTIPPKISSTDIFEGAKFENDKDITIKITDNLSGIESYNGYIDGKWILFEFEPKKNLIIYNFDDRISKTGKKHDFLLEVKDERGNRSTFETFFYY